MLAVISLLLVVACRNKLQFNKTKSGLEYVFIEKHEKNKAPQINDVMLLDVDFYWNDSLLVSTKNSEYLRLQLHDYKTNGVLNEALQMMKVGDSAIFIIDAFYFNNITSQIPLPSCIRKGDVITLYVRFMKLYTQNEVLLEQERIKKIKLQNEQEVMNNYITTHNLKPKKLDCGIYYCQMKAGNGKTPRLGDSVTVHFDAKVINSEHFDDSKKHNKPYSFVLGDSTMVKGWTMGILNMREGEIAKIISPSAMAYGEKGVPDIVPPFSAVIFDIHLLKVKHNNK